MNRKLLVLLALAAIAVILGYRLKDWDFDWSLFFASLWDVQPSWLLASLVATLLSYVIRAFRWQVLLNPLKFIRIQPLISTTVVGFSAIYLLGRAGEIVRPLWLTRREHVPLTASFATIIVERFFDSVMLILLFAWALLFVQLPIAAGYAIGLMKTAAWLMIAGSVAAFVSLSIFRSNVDRLVEYIPFAKLANLVKNFAEGLGFLQKARSFGMALAHSGALWTVIALQFWFMLLGMNFELGLPAATLVLVGAALGSIAQVPGIGGGFQAGYVFCMTTFFSIPAEQAIATSLIAWAFSYAPTIALAGVYMIFNGLSFKDLRAATVSD